MGLPLASVGSTDGIGANYARAAGDVHARDQLPSFSELFETHLPYVLRLLRYLGAPPADVEDIGQEVFVTVHRKLPSYEGRGRFTSWLYAICAGAVRDQRTVDLREGAWRGQVEGVEAKRGVMDV